MHSPLLAFLPVRSFPSVLRAFGGPVSSPDRQRVYSIMANGYEEAAHPSGKAEQTALPIRSATADKERVILLECRLDQLRGQLDDRARQHA